jgi:hypothetical protein
MDGLAYTSDVRRVGIINTRGEVPTYFFGVRTLLFDLCMINCTIPSGLIIHLGIPYVNLYSHNRALAEIITIGEYEWVTLGLILVIRDS